MWDLNRPLLVKPLPNHLLELTFEDSYCSSCGTPTRLDRVDNALAGKDKAHQALNCAVCGVMFQLAERKDVLRAATASGGDMVEYYVDEEPEGCNKSN